LAILRRARRVAVLHIATGRLAMPFRLLYAIPVAGRRLPPAPARP